MKIVKDWIILQYPPAGTKVGSPEYQRTVHKDDADQFVAIDSASGGYPCSTTLPRAYNFKTVEEAVKYQGTGNNEGFIIRRVQITYELM